MVSAKDISIINFTLCEFFKKDAIIKRASSLKMLEKQLEGPLSTRPLIQQAAFTSFWINSQKPFESNNTSTAVLSAFSLLDYTPGDELFHEYSNAVKNSSGVQELMDILDSYV